MNTIFDFQARAFESALISAPTLARTAQAHRAPG